MVTARSRRPTLAEALERLSEGIRRVEAVADGDKTQKLSIRENVELYTIVFDLCHDSRESRDNQNTFCNFYFDSIRNYLLNTVRPVLLEAKGQSHAAFLTAVQLRAKNHKWMVRKLSSIFRFAHYNISPTLREEGEQMFQTHIFDEMKDDIVAAILGLIREKRDESNNNAMTTNNNSDNDSPDSAKEHVEMYKDLGGCLDALRDAFLADTRVYYAPKRDEWISHSDYYVKVRAAIEYEEQLLGKDTYLKHCVPKIKSFLEEEMIVSKEAISLFAELHVRRINLG